MVTSLSAALAPKLIQRFEAASMRLSECGQTLAVFPAKHPDVGDVVIQDDGDELTVFIGRFTHAHFDNHDESLSEHDRASRIADDVVEFLAQLFADEIELYGSVARKRGERRRGAVSRFLFGQKTYVWSGPLP